jgi:cellulose synthase/poly-beta-1,6-N-acetylglucosamine synthase-like glycosyltransferase
MSLALAVVVGFWALYQLWRWLGTAPGRPAGGATAEAGAPPAVGRVSFLVAAWNAAAEIPAFVAAFRALSYPDKELVLCAGGRDGSLAVARALEGPDLRVLEQLPGEGKQRALRKAFPLAQGDVLYLTDIDCRPNDAAVLPLLRALAAGAEAATGGIRPLSAQEGSAFVRAQWAIERVNAQRTGLRSSGLRGANAAVRRRAVEASGAFAQEAPSGTDYTLAKELARQGVAIAFCRDSEMPTGFPDALGTYVRKQARWLRNVALLGARYGAWGEVRGVALTMALPCVIGALLLLGIWRWPLAGLGLLLLLHALINRLRYLRAGELPRGGLGGAAATVAGDMAAALVACGQTLRGRLTWT